MKNDCFVDRLYIYVQCYDFAVIDESTVLKRQRPSFESENQFICDVSTAPCGVNVVQLTETVFFSRRKFKWFLFLRTIEMNALIFCTYIVYSPRESLNHQFIITWYVKKYCQL